MFSQHLDLSGYFGKTASRCEPLQRFWAWQETAKAIHEWGRERPLDTTIHRGAG